jgi:hypothetical protein
MTEFKSNAIFQGALLSFPLILLNSFLQALGRWGEQFATLRREGNNLDDHTDADSTNDLGITLCHRRFIVNQQYKDVFMTLEEQRSCQRSPFFIEQNIIMDTRLHHSASLQIRDFGINKKSSDISVVRSVSFAC